MNMKKSLAGVMAGAMAVSAMATVVSADQDAISLTYDLKTYVNTPNKEAAKVTVVANYDGSLISKKSVQAGYVSFGVDNSFVRSGDVYNKDGVKIGTVPAKGNWDDSVKSTAKDSELVEFEFSARPYKDLVTNLEGGYQTFKATSDAKNADGAYYDKTMGSSVYNMQINTDGNAVTGKFDLSKFDIFSLGYSEGAVKEMQASGLDKVVGSYTAQPDKEEKVYTGKYYTMDNAGNKTYLASVDVNRLIPAKDDNGNKIEDGYYLYNYADGNDVIAQSTSIVYKESVIKKTPQSPEYKLKDGEIVKGTYAVRDAVAKLTYKVPNIVKLNKANGWGWDVDASAEKVEKIANNYYNTSLTGDVTMSAEVFSGGFFNNAGTKRGMISSDTTLVSAPTTVAVGAFTAGVAADAVWPFKTTLKPSLKTDKYPSGYTKNTGLNENDVIAALQSRKAGNNYYTKPVAVLNDAIANHDNVVFTFTSYNGYVGTEKSHLLNQWVNIDQGYDYKTSDYDWHNPTFGQHLYTNLADAYSLFDSNEYDQYGSYSSAWGINLFTGAVVVNSGLTMQLSDTDIFNWGNNTLSFDWFDITDEGKITDAKTFLTSMLLYTPTDWYWDTLTVVVSDDEDEAIDAGEGLDGEGDVIDDEEPAEDVVEEEPTEDVVEEPAETEAAPVETAPSPATGNAPVALAVIPVALAAAAVVAKKRG